jgi:hypothetical protein
VKSKPYQDADRRLSTVRLFVDNCGELLRKRNHHLLLRRLLREGPEVAKEIPRVRRAIDRVKDYDEQTGLEDRFDKVLERAEKMAETYRTTTEHEMSVGYGRGIPEMRQLAALLSDIFAPAPAAVGPARGSGYTATLAPANPQQLAKLRERELQIERSLSQIDLSTLEGKVEWKRIRRQLRAVRAQLNESERFDLVGVGAGSESVTSERPRSPRAQTDAIRARYAAVPTYEQILEQQREETARRREERDQWVKETQSQWRQDMDELNDPETWKDI